MFPELTRHTRVLEIVGDTIPVKAEVLRVHGNIAARNGPGRIIQPQDNDSF
jgi:hypothetical protein